MAQALQIALNIAGVFLGVAIGVCFLIAPAFVGLLFINFLRGNKQ